MRVSVNHARVPARPRLLGKWVGRGTIHLIMIVLCLAMVFPLLWAIVTSFKQPGDVFSLSPVSPHPTLANYTAVFSSLPFLQLILNTFLYAILMTVLMVGLAVIAAYAFARWNFPGKNLLFLLFVGTLIVPGQITIIPNYLLLAQLGWLNSLVGLIVPQLATGFGIFYLRQAFRSFPRALYDAAEIDGAGPWRVLWHVVIPASRAVIAALAILVFIQAWNEYFWPLLVMQNASNLILQIGLQLFLEDSGNMWGPLMAAALMSFLPILVLYIVAQRQIMDAFVHSGIR